MRVAVKFVLAVVLTLVVVRSLEGMLTVQRETARLDATIERDAELLGRMLKTSVRNAWQSNGRKRALDLIEAMNVGGHPIHLSWAPFEGEDALADRLEADALAKLASGDTVAVRKQHVEKGAVQYFFVPLDLPEADGAIRMTEALEDRSRYVQHALIRELVAGTIVVLSSGAAIIVLGVFVIGRPLTRLQERIRRIGEGDLSARVVLRGRDEFSALAEGLNETCARLAASQERERAETAKRLAAMEQMRHMDRLTTIGRLASGVAHELGTPLNVVCGRAGMICDGTIPLGSEEVRRNAQTILTQADRMTKIIRRLLDFARQRPPKRVAADGGKVVRQAVDLVECLGYTAKVRVEPVGAPPSLVTKMDPVQIQQVMTNLIDNALQAMPQGGYATVRLESITTRSPEGIESPDGRFLRITVEDQGVGIAQEDLPSIFDPFFTTKDVGQGTGLGLSIAYGIIREHGGWIDVASKIDRGSRFTVYLPQEEA